MSRFRSCCSPVKTFSEAANEQSNSETSCRNVATSLSVACKSLMLTLIAVAGSGRASVRVVVTMRLNQREAMSLHDEMMYTHMTMFTEQAAAHRGCSGHLGEVCLTQPPGS